MSSAIDIHARNLAIAIRDHRVLLNLTQPEAAASLGVSLRTLQAWEAGSTFPRASHRRRLETWFVAERDAA